MVNAVRTFSCLIQEEASSAPTSYFILAQNEGRARELARREMRRAGRPVSVELREGGERLWSERFPPV